MLKRNQKRNEGLVFELPFCMQQWILCECFFFSGHSKLMNFSFCRWLKFVIFRKWSKWNIRDGWNPRSYLHDTLAFEIEYGIPVLETKVHVRNCIYMHTNVYCTYSWMWLAELYFHFVMITGLIQCDGILFVVFLVWGQRVELVSVFHECLIQIS